MRLVSQHKPGLSHINQASDLDFHQIYKRKDYPHFELGDPDYARKIKEDSSLVEKHSFFPFIEKEKVRRKFRRKGEIKRPPKKRLLRRASTNDSFIFKLYREKLSLLYENLIREYDLDQSVLAYRKIPSSTNNRNKSNIDFAYEAFIKINKMDECVVIALDIKSFFENIPHSVIKKMWKKLLNSENLPKDHYQVYKNITSYSYIKEEEIYRGLNLLKNYKDFSGSMYQGLPPYKERKKKICSLDEYRQKIVPLVKKNKEKHGIPQGAPLSDLIANFSLFEFDLKMKNLLENEGGEYFRYADDLFLIIPTQSEKFFCKTSKWEDAISKIIDEELKNIGPMLSLSREKTSCFKYEKVKGSTSQIATNLNPNHKKDKLGISYLGFRYDGKRIYIKNSSISNFQRKLNRKIHRWCRGYIKNNPSFSYEEVKSNFPYFNVMRSEIKFPKKSKKNSAAQGKAGSFYKYAQQAEKIFSLKGSDIESRVLNQLRALSKINCLERRFIRILKREYDLFHKNVNVFPL
ncbi:hypothetical protein E3E11_03215 [Oecophyllibacter saccharovorans]|uniref:reverse transcriptase domain-containing protein n=1 Tax=Oecophyllibacter saccharovorans TaxID=2558360 RepID=UPI0011447533|nr:reverse transcriptase domain-containing protein [Oecophyllibacter saccharovorans]QDH15037.1 hypothetical protein E3E11_03215 [Oecophyllibacter saccharovorans]